MSWGGNLSVKRWKFECQEQGLKSTGSTGALLPGRDLIARKVDHKQKINDIYIVLIKYWPEADQGSETTFQALVKRRKLECI